MHRDDEVPPPVSPAIVRPSLLHGAAAVLATLALIYAAVFLYRWATEPIVVSGTSASTEAETRPAAASPPAMPPEVIQMAVAVSTSLAPTLTPIPPTPTPEPPPSPVVVHMVCGEGVPIGALCAMATATPPPPTPMADCPVSPGELCVWRGGSITWLSPTPTAESNMTSGSVNQ